MTTDNIVTREEQVKALREALEQARYELVVLIPRVTPEFARNLQAASDKAKAALALRVEVAR